MENPITIEARRILCLGIMAGGSNLALQSSEDDELDAYEDILGYLEDHVITPQQKEKLDVIAGSEDIDLISHIIADTLSVNQIEAFLFEDGNVIVDLIEDHAPGGLKEVVGGMASDDKDFFMRLSDSNKMDLIRVGDSVEVKVFKPESEGVVFTANVINVEPEKSEVLVELDINGLFYTAKVKNILELNR